MVTHTTCPIRLWLGMEQVLLLFLLISFDGLDLHLSPCLCFLLISFHELDLHIYPCPCFLLNSVLDLHLSPWLCLLISFHNLVLHFYPCLCFLHGIWERRGHNNCVQISIIFFFLMFTSWLHRKFCLHDEPNHCLGQQNPALHLTEELITRRAPVSYVISFNE